MQAIGTNSHACVVGAEDSNPNSHAYIKVLLSIDRPLGTRKAEAGWSYFQGSLGYVIRSCFRKQRNEE